MSCLAKGHVTCQVVVSFTLDGFCTGTTDIGVLPTNEAQNHGAKAVVGDEIDEWGSWKSEDKRSRSSNCEWLCLQELP